MLLSISFLRIFAEYLGGILRLISILSRYELDQGVICMPYVRPTTQLSDILLRVCQTVFYMFVVVARWCFMVHFSILRDNFGMVTL
jgi:hypothetical protein